MAGRLPIPLPASRSLCVPVSAFADAVAASPSSDAPPSRTEVRAFIASGFLVGVIASSHGYGVLIIYAPRCSALIGSSAHASSGLPCTGAPAAISERVVLSLASAHAGRSSALVRRAGVRVRALALQSAAGACSARAGGGTLRLNIAKADRVASAASPRRSS